MTNYARVRLVVLVTTLVAALGLVRAQQVAPPSIPPAVRAATLEQVVPVDPLITKPEFWFFSLAPIFISEGSLAQQQMRAAFDEFRQLFPPALCYTKIVPVDEVISLPTTQTDTCATMLIQEPLKGGVKKGKEKLAVIATGVLDEKPVKDSDKMRLTCEP